MILRFFPPSTPTEPPPVSYSITPQSPRPQGASEAIQACHRSIAIATSVKALYRLSCAREMLGQMRSAIAAVKAAIALEVKEAAVGQAKPSAELAMKLKQLEEGTGQALQLSETQQQAFLQ